jgi:cell wall assembly regulator SMI1
MTTNGPCVGPGGIVGVNTARELQNLESIYDLYPNWKAKRWIPVAGDGCGNYYVLVHGEHERTPVVFVDVMENSDEPAFVVASSLWQFLDFLFRKDLGMSRWPFDKTEVTETDAKILETDFVLPWNA